MGQICLPRPVLLIMAVFSRYEEALEWSRQQAAQAWGPLALSSDVFDFDETPYYEKSMGPALKKQLLAFSQLIDPGQLADIKLATNQWEVDYATQQPRPEPRPVNLDPGYLTEAKLVLATTKDRDHRMYIGQGIFAEVTLYYHGRRWCDRPWTYPDYQRDDYHQFFSRCREFLREQLRDPPKSSSEP